MRYTRRKRHTKQTQKQKQKQKHHGGTMKNKNFIYGLAYLLSVASSTLVNVAETGTLALAGAGVGVAAITDLGSKLADAYGRPSIANASMLNAMEGINPIFLQEPKSDGAITQYDLKNNSGGKKKNRTRKMRPKSLYM